ncbi:hypothetical protein GQ457_05G026110 [Hibiscus cannabinus]
MVVLEEWGLRGASLLCELRWVVTSVTSTIRFILPNRVGGITKKPGHTQYDCPRFKKKGSSHKKKAFVDTCSDEDDSNENEKANLCLMAIQDEKVTSNSSISNSYKFDALQIAYDELVLEFENHI